MTEQEQADERVELPGVLESILRYCLKDAQSRMEGGEEIVPFSALAAGETLFCEQHPGNTPEDCFAEARHTVEHARGSQGYGFCYDGYVNTDQGQKDALIAQGGVPGDETGYAIATLYEVGEDGALSFAEEPVFLGNCTNFMEGLRPEEPEEDEAAEGVAEVEATEDDLGACGMPIDSCAGCAQSTSCQTAQ